MNSRLAFMLPLVLFAMLAVAFAWEVMRDDREELPTVFLDKPMPAWPAEGLDGYRYADAEELKSGGYKLVNFWASWCPPCRAEHPLLMQLAGEGWKIYGVNKEDKPLNAKGFLDELGNPYTAIAVDPRGRIGVDWGVYGLPETFLIDGEGRIRHRFPGAVTKRVWRSAFCLSSRHWRTPPRAELRAHSGRTRRAQPVHNPYDFSFCNMLGLVKIAAKLSTLIYP